MHGLMMDYPLTLDRILEHANRIYGYKKIHTKLTDGSIHTYTYADAYKRIKRLSSALVKRGINPGDRLGTFGWNNYQHFELYFGIPGCQAVCHTLNIRLFPEQIAYIVQHAEDRMIFVDASLPKVVESFGPQISSVENYVIYGATGPVETSLPNVILYEDLLAEGDASYQWPVMDENTAFGMCYTSGTTGEPKGALFSH